MSARSPTRHFDGVHIACTTRADGDFAWDASGVDARRRAATPVQPVVWLRQVHGARVVLLDHRECAEDEETCTNVDEELGAVMGAQADGIVAARAGVALSVVTADCAPVAFWSADGLIGVAHAGWRGLLDGVIENTIELIRSRTRPSTQVQAFLGPCIHPCCYEFGRDDLDLIARAYGDRVRGWTRSGADALDLPAAVAEAIQAGGAQLRVAGEGDDQSDPSGLNASCTACSPGQWYSWRARRDPQRQAMLIWRSTDEPRTGLCD